MTGELTRRRFAALMLSAGAASRLPVTSSWAQRNSATRNTFVHPGLLHNSADLHRMKSAVAAKEEPIFSGFVKLRDHSQSQPTYVPAGASTEIGRNPNVRFLEFDQDCNAAYQCALMGGLTGDVAFWRVAVRVLNDWASTLKLISGADAILCASLGGFKLINAAELVCWSDAGWSGDNVLRFSDFLREVVIPVLQGFAPFANGNWDTAAMKTLLAASVFLEDRELFERVLVYYNHGCGDGRLSNYIYESGQCQESGRDQQHTQLGLAHLGDCCEIAWHQGLDLYGMTENRLLAGFEYTARYGLGEEVPFLPDIDRTGKYRHSIISSRSALRPVYEQIFNHYVHRRGLAAPWTERAASAVRPEGAGFQADHTGFGTLLYTRTGPDRPTDGWGRIAATGLYACNEGTALQLSWVPPVEQAQVQIVRVGSGSAKYKSVSAPNASIYTDSTAQPGNVYTYHIETGRFARPAMRLLAYAGCPNRWRRLQPGVAGDVLYDGTVWKLSGTGADLSRMFSVVVAARARRITARLLPEYASAMLHAGVVIAASSTDIFATLLLEPAGELPSERGGWVVRLRTASQPNGALGMQAEQLLSSPQVLYGRVRTPLWLRVRWDGGLLRAESSGDGTKWVEVGTVVMAQQAPLAGLGVMSGVDGVSASALFDHVDVE